MLRLIPLLLLAQTALADPPPHPTSASLRKAFEANASHLVKVKGGRKAGPGVLVSAEGHVVTSTEYIKLDTATLSLNGEDQPVDVVFADAKLKVAVVRPHAGTFSASAVELSKPVATGDWLLAISPKKDGTPEPKVGQVLRTDTPPFFETDLYLPAGTPLFDPRGKLVAVLVTSKGRALGVGFVKARLDEAQRLNAAAGAP